MIHGIDGDAQILPQTLRRPARSLKLEVKINWSALLQVCSSIFALVGLHFYLSNTLNLCSTFGRHQQLSNWVSANRLWYFRHDWNFNNSCRSCLKETGAKVRHQRAALSSTTLIICTSLTASVIKVCVGTGKNQRFFYVHQSLLCSQSEFFKKALNGKWKESEENSINLSEDDPEIFSLYLEQLYTGSLPILGDTVEVIPSDFNYTTLAELYILAEKLMDVKTKNNVLDGILRASRMSDKSGASYFPSFTTVETIYNGTPGPCAGRRLMVDLYLFQATTCNCENDDFSLMPDFANDLIHAFLKSTTDRPADITKTCDLSDYHET